MTRKKAGRPFKKHTCTLFPDAVSREGFDRTGEKYGKLTFLYIVGREDDTHRLFWLSECTCGAEVFAIWGRTASCPDCREWGKTRKHVNRAAIIRLPKESGKKAKKCHQRNSEYTCLHYRQCTDERVFERKKMSDRETAMGGQCYEAGSEQIKYERGVE